MIDLRNILVFLSFAVISLGLLVIIIWGELKIVIPMLKDEYSEYGVWIIIATIILWIWKILPFLGEVFAPLYSIGNSSSSKNEVHKTVSKANQVTHASHPNNPSPIISKALGGYNREQLNEIYLFGILIHQLYMSCNLSERQQRKSLSIQMRFFVTVFPQRDVAEYFDFSEQFISKYEHLASLSLDKCVAQSMQRLSDCNNKQIDKLRNLFRTLGTAYEEQVGGGNSKMMSAFLNLLDVELSNLKTEEDWRDSYAKKKTH
ncbi:MAG: hypothetical protein NC311_13645 [Muribaculaceae bacterium]|nr:hypothetical protein [Muribaculaceae bacterium]